MSRQAALYAPQQADRRRRNVYQAKLATRPSDQSNHTTLAPRVGKPQLPIDEEADQIHNCSMSRVYKNGP